MASEVVCSKYGPFNGVYALEQSNWALFFRGVIPTCVLSSRGGTISEFDGEMETYAVSGGEGMQVRVRKGQAFVNGHHVWVDSEQVLTLESANASNPRNDIVVLRVVYGNNGESKTYLAIKTGTPAATPSDPTVTQVTGTTFEYKLARIRVEAGATTILPSKITNLRYVWRAYNNEAVTFSSNSVTPQTDVEYRNFDTQSSMTINLPETPFQTYITSVRFYAGSSYTGTIIKQGTTTIYNASNNTNNIRLSGDNLNLKSRMYTLIIWWDGTRYWVASAAGAAL